MKTVIRSQASIGLISNYLKRIIYRGKIVFLLLVLYEYSRLKDCCCFEW